MATTKHRINISVSKNTRDALQKLARRDEVPEATKAAHLLMLALEIEEDRFFEQLARVRLKNKTHFISDNDGVWR
ncbi:MAG: hypothetical protein HYT27_00845 [Parcubacteria group bacterium]|nr:hypothetical protein [Parcubacteria group bacterium]